MPLHQFVNCLMGDETVSNWDEIFSEYTDLSGDISTKQVLSIMKEINFLSNKIFLVRYIVSGLAVKYNEQLVNLLKQQGYRLEYKEENLVNDLNITLTQLKSLEIKLNQRKGEYAELQKSQGNAATKQDYEIQLTELSKFQGYNLDWDILTVSKYCAILHRFKLANKPR